MALDFAVTTAHEASVPILHVSGEVDVATKSTLQEALDDCIEAGETTIVVDLRKVSFIDSTGLGVLVATLKRCRDADGDLRLLANTPRVLQLLAITGLDQTFVVAATPADALEAVAEPQAD